MKSLNSIQNLNQFKYKEIVNRNQLLQLFFIETIKKTLKTINIFINLILSFVEPSNPHDGGFG